MDDDRGPKPLGVAMAVIRVVRGSNFSGRSDALRDIVNRERNGCNRPVAYVGPDAFSSFSGLTANVREETLLYGSDWARIASQFRIRHLQFRDLNTLSGGEETLCAIAVSSSLETRTIVIDCALEQLDIERREILLHSLVATQADAVFIADNRLSEWKTTVPLEELGGMTSRSSHPHPGIIRGDTIFPAVDFIPNEIALENIRHRYGCGEWILDNVSMVLAPGTVTHLAGVNGSGKSTLAKILVGAIRPSSGRIEVNGPPVTRSLCQFWNSPGRVFAFHFQHPDAQLFCSSVSDELAVGAWREGRSEREVKALVDSAANAFGLESIIRTHPHDLPFVLRKRVALAATFACGTPWIILDEPTLGQDDATLLELVSLIQRTAATGVGFIVISHSETFIKMLQPKRLLLHDGRVRQLEGV